MFVKRLIALISAVVVPFLLFVIVISLNESDNEQEKQLEKQVKFDVAKQKKIEKPKSQPRPKPKRHNKPAALPSVKPTDIGSSLTGNGLSFGVPQFDEAKFADIDDSDLLNSVAGKVMDKDVVDTRPKVIKRAPIVYPELARQQGISGYVTMNVLIDEMGNVDDVKILDAKPKEMFELQADSTIRMWKFEPATYNGKKVKVWAMQKMVFRLN